MAQAPRGPGHIGMSAYHPVWFRENCWVSTLPPANFQGAPLPLRMSAFITLIFNGDHTRRTQRRREKTEGRGVFVMTPICKIRPPKVHFRQRCQTGFLDHLNTKTKEYAVQLAVHHFTNPLKNNCLWSSNLLHPIRSEKSLIT